MGLERQLDRANADQYSLHDKSEWVVSLYDIVDKIVLVWENYVFHPKRFL